MLCQHCGHESAAGAKVCEQCGAALEEPEGNATPLNEKLHPEEMPLKFSELDSWEKTTTIRWLSILAAIVIVYLVFACVFIHSDKTYQDQYWNEGISPNQDTLAYANQIADEKGATKVKVGTYVENIKSLSVKDSLFTVDMTIWFTWDGDPDLDMAHNFRIYKGTIDNLSVVSEVHEGNTNYQLVRIRSTVTRRFHTTRFPLESLQLRIYIESNSTVDKVIFEPDYDNSGINDDLGFSGYDVTRHATAISAYKYNTNEGNIDLTADETPITSEYLTNIEMNRSGWGLYLICFAAMYGTSLWTLVALFLAARHAVDPLGMLPGALFGTVSNVMVGAAMLPASLDVGLLVFVNIFGIMTILLNTIIIIMINRIRSNLGRGPHPRFARMFGTWAFRLSLAIVLIGNIMLPVCAYFSF